MKRRFIYLTIGLLLAYLLFNSISFSDEAMARTFIAKGDEAMKQNKYDQALDLYLKAADESPNMPEAHFKIGETYLKLKNESKCRSALRKCFRLIGAMDNPSEALLKLKKQAQEMMINSSELSKGYEKIHLEYVKEMMSFVKRMKAKDNYLADSALDNILWVDVKNEEGRKLREELKAGRFVKKWIPLLDTSKTMNWFWGPPDNWLTENDSLVCDTKTEAIAAHSIASAKGDFKVSVDFRIVNPHGTEYSAGLMLAYVTGFKSIAIHGTSSLTLFNHGDQDQTTGEFRKDLIKGEPLTDALNPNEWNKLMINITGKNIKVYVNNKMRMDYNCDFSFDGGLGLIAEKCRVSFRDLKYTE